MVVLDSSGSVFNVFEEERKIVQNLLDSLVPSALEDGRIQVFHNIHLTQSLLISLYL